MINRTIRRGVYAVTYNVLIVKLYRHLLTHNASLYKTLTIPNPKIHSFNKVAATYRLKPISSYYTSVWHKPVAGNTFIWRGVQ